ncbi:glycosyltransferase family 2 protein [Parafrankia discariae]|uniref:glycosyltransferase family 2 protein n=1 Tax=Parafrankia discariae TaxID=365528 RepID=UPI000376B78B|nr:glycosyltransferase family 2 protein [Parafrankia discariae]
MTVVGIAMVRDEADIIAGTLRHMAGEVDQLLVADNGSTDGTREILDALIPDLPLVVVDDRDPAYYQSAKMTKLAGIAHRLFEATWIVPFDADELWYSPADRIADVLTASRRPYAVADLYNHLATALDEPGDDPFRTMVWRQTDPGPLGKVALRWQPGAVIHQGNHGVTLPAGGPPLEGALAVRHFPARSPQQFARKGRNGAAAYAAAPDLPEHEGAHWRAYGRLHAQGGDELLHEVFREHWWYLSPTDAGLLRDPAPYRWWES